MIERLMPQAVLQVTQVNSRAREGTEASFLDVLAAGDTNAHVGSAILPDGISLGSIETSQHLFEFHVQRDSGELEVFALPWRLRSSAELAQSVAMGMQSELATRVAECSPGPETISAVPAQADIVRLPSVISAASAAGSESIAARPLPIVFEPLDLRAAEQRSAAATALTTALPWAERLIRWIEEQGSGSSVWIRDYRLDDETARQLGEAMKAAAREHGIVIQKIVVNAREIWRNPAVDGCSGG